MKSTALIILFLVAQAKAESTATPVSLENVKEDVEIVQMASDKKEEAKKETKPVVKKEVKKVAPKKNAKKAVKEKGQLITLEDGRKYKVFENKVDELPKEVGVVYVDRKSFNEMLDKESKAKEAAKNEIQIVVKEEKAEEILPVVKTEEKNMLLMTAKPVEEDPVNKLQEEAKVPLMLSNQEPTPMTPVSVEIRQQIENLFDVGVNQGQVLVDERAKAAVELEKKLLAEEIAKAEAIKAKEDLQLREQKALTEMTAKEENIRKNSQLSEGNDVPSAPAKVEDMKTVNLSNKNTAVAITLPKPQNQEAQKTVMLLSTMGATAALQKSQLQEGDLLEESEAMEEANGPDYSGLGGD